jgi:hypothetical protein
MKNKVKNISVISTGSWVPSNLNDQEVKTPSYKILIKSLVLNASIGIHEFEKKKKQKISIEDIKKKTPKIVFYTDKLKINLKSMSSLDFWFAKYPNGKYIVND